MTHVILALVLNLYSGSWVDPTSLLAEPRTKLVTGLNILIDSLVSETFDYSFRTALRKDRFGKEAISVFEESDARILLSFHAEFLLSTHVLSSC